MGSSTLGLTGLNRGRCIEKVEGQIINKQKAKLQMESKPRSVPPEPLSPLASRSEREEEALVARQIEDGENERAARTTG